jgi:hypothetical protein
MKTYRRIAATHPSYLNVSQIVEGEYGFPSRFLN